MRSSGPPAGSGGPPSNACAPVRTPDLDLAPGGVYRAAPVTRGAGGLLHHRFTLTGPSLARSPGGLLSVALSRGSPRVAVGNHPALWSPDFPRPPEGDRGCPAVSSAPERTGRHTLGRPPARVHPSTDGAAEAAHTRRRTRSSYGALRTGPGSLRTRC